MPELAREIGAAGCPACATGSGARLGEKNGCLMRRCGRCGTVFAEARGASGALEELYDQYYERATFELPPAVRGSLEQVVVSCERFRATGRWLDVGYGEGGLLSVAQVLGWSCHGTEVSPQALEYGRKQGWTVVDGAGGRGFPDEYFDVVTMIEILEHLPDPDGALRRAAHWLRPGGLLYLTTPNAGSINSRLLGLRWSIYAPPEHFTIWTGKGIRSALSRAGLVVRRIRTDGLNPCEIVARSRKRANGASVDRNACGLQLNATFSSSPFRRKVKSAINACLSAVGAGDTLKVWAVRE